MYYVHATIAEAAGMSSWGVFITSLLRSLLQLHPLVHESYAERIVAPLARAGVTVATHIVVVGKWAALNHTQLEEAVRDTYTPSSLCSDQGANCPVSCVRCVRSHSSSHMVPARNDAQDLFSLGEVDHLLDAHQVVRTWIFVRVWAWAREGQD